MTTVTTLRNSGIEDLPDDEYRAIYDELRGRHEDGTYVVSLDDFVEMIDSSFTKGTWSKYHRGLHVLSREQRNELRKCVGLFLLPPDVAKLMDDVDRDAQVVQVGEYSPNKVILVNGAEPTEIIVTNEMVTAKPFKPVTVVTSIRRARKHHQRPWITTAQEQAFQLVSQRGYNWKDVIDAGLAVLGSNSEP